MRLIRLVLASFLFVLVTSVSAQSVYITKTGEKYHKESCHYLRYSKKEVQLKNALEFGYVACLVCKPPKKTGKTSSKNSFIEESKAKPRKSSSSSSSSSSSKKAVASQCTGRTKSGRRCKRRTKNVSGRCYQH